MLYAIPVGGESTVIFPLEAVHMGCVTLAVGRAGDEGWGLITTGDDGAEVQPSEFLDVTK